MTTGDQERDKLVRALGDVLPYAESRAEDLEAAAEVAEVDATREALPPVADAIPCRWCTKPVRADAPGGAHAGCAALRGDPTRRRTRSGPRPAILGQLLVDEGMGRAVRAASAAAGTSIAEWRRRAYRRALSGVVGA